MTAVVLSMVEDGFIDKDLSLATPVIVKYRDEKTDTAVRLEDYLR